MVGNLQIYSWNKRKIDNFDPYNVFLAIANMPTNMLWLVLWSRVTYCIALVTPDNLSRCHLRSVAVSRSKDVPPLALPFLKAWPFPSRPSSGTSCWPRWSTGKTRRTNRRSSVPWQPARGRSTSRTSRRTSWARRRWTLQWSSASSRWGPRRRSGWSRGRTPISRAWEPSRGAWWHGISASRRTWSACWGFPTSSSCWSKRSPRTWFLTAPVGMSSAGRLASWASRSSTNVGSVWFSAHDNCGEDIQEIVQRLEVRVFLVFF